MLQEMFTAMGVNPSLMMDVGFIIFLAMGAFLVMILSTFKGVAIPLVRAKFRKENVAILDTGGIETPLINYPRGASSISQTIGEHDYTWSIPERIEGILPNGIRYILISRSYGKAFNVGLMAMEASAQARIMSPQSIANTIDDRSKQISDKLTSNINKPAVLATAVGIIFIVCLFGYLVFTKAMEYDLAQQTIRNIGQLATTTTTLQLPPLD